jgi:hypothetical protein
MSTKQEALIPEIKIINQTTTKIKEKDRYFEEKVLQLEKE